VETPEGEADTRRMAIELTVEELIASGYITRSWENNVEVWTITEKGRKYYESISED
jgi:predicted transcriptional regulator